MKSLKLKTLVASLAAVLAAPAFASIAGGTTGNGELFLSVLELDKASYTFDTGILMSDFFVAGQPTVVKKAISINIANDPLYQTFLSKVNATNLLWMVTAFDSTGPNTPNSKRLFTTVNMADTDKVATMANAALPLALSQGNTFFSDVNDVGFAATGHSTHSPTLPGEFTRNGSSYSLAADTIAPKALIGRKGGITPNYNTNATFLATSKFGETAAFDYITQSDGVPAHLVLAQHFSFGAGALANVSAAGLNAVGSQYGLTFNGSTLTAVPVPVPEPESYALLVAGLVALGLVVRRRRQA